jgi:hypothetical protein
MSEPTQSNTKAVTQGCPPMPNSLLKAKRDELTDIKLTITEAVNKLIQEGEKRASRNELDNKSMCVQVALRRWVLRNRYEILTKHSISDPVLSFHS